MTTAAPLRHLPVLVLVAALYPAILQGQEVEAVCDLEDAFSSRVNQAKTKAAEAPQVTASTTQLGAPSSVSASTSLVDGAVASELFNLAVENGLATSENGVITLGLNVFAIRAAFEPEIIDRQSLYGTQANSRLRRWSGSLSLGGKGEEFDRDGDGEADEALEAQDLDDIVNLELKFRLLGSRDRRDQDNWAYFNGEMSKVFEDAASKMAQLTDLTAEALAASPRSDQAIHPTQEGCFRADVFWEILESDPRFKEFLDAFDSAEAKLAEAVEPALKKIDSSFILTAVTGITERKEAFGPDRWMVGLRGAYYGLSFNLEHSQVEGLLGAPDPTMTEVAVEGAFRWLEGRPTLEDKGGVRVSFSVAYETFEDVPDAVHTTNAKLNAKLEYPLTKAVKLPISITWANHANLLTDENEIRGHVGFTIDTSALKKLILGDESDREAVASN